MSISAVLGTCAFLCLIYSMSQHDIVKLRIWGAIAGACFCFQFIIEDMPFINIAGQGGLVVYGIYQAHRESTAKTDIV